MPPIPSLQSVSRSGRHVLMDNVDTVEGFPVILDSSEVTDAGSSPTSIIRAGNVIVLRTSTGKFVNASSANADVPTPATVTATETANGSWASKVVDFSVNGGPIFSVTLGAADDTDAEVAAAFNADARFKGELIADVLASRVRVRTLKGGSNQTLYVKMNTYTTPYGASGTNGGGADVEALVTMESEQLTDDAGAAADRSVRVYRKAHFDLSELIVAGTAGNLKTAAPNAYAALVQQGCKFSS